ETNRFLMFPLLEPFNSKRTDLINQINDFTYKDDYNSNGIYSYATEVQNETYTIQIDGTSLGFSTGVDNSSGNEINLGSFNILENSERVSIGGEILVKGLDYDINYFTGIVTLKSARAILGKQDIEIEYERSDLFALDKRTLLGAVLGYQFSENASIGATALYLKKSSLEEKVRIGQEPFENFIWDLNGNYQSDSRFLTRAINLLPGIETNAPSSFSFETEFAQILPNPNTKDNDKTGDQDGVAFIDDFEGAKRKNGISLSRRSWYPSSVPLIINDQSVTEQQGDSTRSQISFFNPYIRMDSRIIFDKEVNSRIGNDLLTLLNLAVRKQTIIYDDNRQAIAVTEQAGKRAFKPKTPQQKAWGGVMASNRSNKDLNNTRFLEVWVKWEYPDRGVTPRLNIDFGQISENYYTKDQVANNTLASELGRTVTVNDIENGLFNESSEDVAGFVPDNTLQDIEDVGLDRLNKNEEILIYGVENPYDNWVGMDALAKQSAFTFKNSLLENGEFKPDIVTGIPWRINGTEQNSQESGVTRSPDKEDIDLNNVVNRENSYFHVEVDLPHDFNQIQSNPYFVSFGNDAEEGWVLLQIPIKELLEKQNGYYPRTSPPDLNNVNFIRVYLDQFDAMNDDDIILVNFAQIEFVSSDWQTLPPKPYDNISFTNSEIGVESDEIRITFLNSDENGGSTASADDNYANYYISPPGVEGDYIDNERTVRGVEQSMVIEINDLAAGDRAEILKQSKFIAQNLSFHNYKKLQLFMRAHQLDANEQGGDRELPTNIDEFKKDGSLKSYFYMKINTTETDFYEYRVPILANSLGGGIPDKNSLGDQKFYWDATKMEIDLDKMTNTKIKGFEEKSPNGKKTYILYEDPSEPLLNSYRAVGNPSINNVKFIMLGVYNADKELEGQDRPLRTNIWVNELRATDVRKDKGSALRFAANAKIADVMTVNANFETRDANFSQIESTSVNPSGLNTTENQSYTLNFNVDKFLDRNTGYKIPIRYFYRRSVTIPKFYQGTDIRTNFETNGIGEKFQHLFGLGEYSDRIQEIYTLSTANDFSISLNKSVTDDSWYNKVLIDGLSYNGKYNETSGSDVQNSRIFSTAANHKVDYSYSFARDNYFMPFAWLGRGSFLDKISQVRVYYTPADIKADLSLDYSKSERDPRFQPDLEPVVKTRSTRSFSLNFNLTDEISSSWSRDYKSNLDQVMVENRKMNFYDLLKNIFTKPFSKDAFGNDYNVTNAFGVGYRPTIVQGLTTTFDYRVNFSYTEDIIKNDASLSLNKTYTSKMSYSPKTLVSKSAAAPVTRSRGRGRPSVNRGKKEVDEADNPKDEKDENEIEAEDDIKGQKDDDENVSRRPGQTQSDNKGGIKFDLDWINPLVWGEQVLSVWERTDFSYVRAIGNSSTLHLQEQPSLSYQFGFADSANVGFVDPNLRKFGGKIDNTYAYKNDFKLSSTISITFDNNYKYSETIDPNDNNTYADTYSIFETDLSVDNFRNFRNLDSLRSARPLSIYLPDWDIRITGVESWPLINLIADRASISHKRTGKLQTQYKNNQITANPIENYQYTISQEYKPLIRLQMDTKLGFSADFSLGNAETVDFKSLTTGSRRTDNSFTLRITYNLKGGFRWPFDFWPFNGSYIENSVNFSFDYTSTESSSENYRDINGVANFVQSQFTNRRKIEPSITYQFSKTVSGSAYYSNEVTESIRIKKLTKNEFGIKVNLTIRN
ncbi:MAG: cell surface protein SprA, partial [Calditrichaeota bacterium]|nr:cell surface protein SprA [Calditrichota bacterium]